MDAEKYRRSVSMSCPTCGNEQFEFESQEGPFRCVSCDRTLSREELISDNKETIDAQVAEMGKEVVKDAAAEMRAHLKKAFQGSKNIKIK